VRTSAFFGPWDSLNFITQTVDQLALGKQVSAADDVWISPSYIPDLAHAALDLLVDREAGIWHLANSGAVTWAAFAHAAARLSGLDESLVRGCKIDELKLPAGRPRRSVLGSERGKLLGSWEGALDRYFRDRAESLPARPSPHSPAVVQT
jgi:dTDP-4-dehydrorhamnose reductase